MKPVITLLAACSIAVAPGLVRAQQPAAKKAAGSPVASYKELKYPPLKEIEIPKVETYTLPNGLRLYLLEDHTWPTISGHALIRTGNLFDPPDKIGLAEATGTVMRTGGTTSKTGDDLDQELESMAADVETGIGETTGDANFFTLQENFDKVLPIYADIVMHPAFREERLDLWKNQTRSSIARRNDEAEQIARREFNNLVYGKDNPYGWQIEFEHVDRIQRADLEQFYRRYFFPGNVMLAVYGDFSMPEMKKKLEAAFKDWNNSGPEGAPPVPPFPKVKESQKGGVFLVTKDDVNQTNIRMGHLGGILKDLDYPALEVMADILGGGGFRSRLVQNVRSKLGYAYSVGARWGATYDHPGLFVVAAGTKSDSTVKAAKAMLDEVNRIRQSPVSDDELKTSKESVLNSFVFNFDTKAKTLNRLLVYEYWSYPKDFIFQYKKKLEGVTKQDVLRVAQKYLHPEELTVLAVGKPPDFDQPLAALGKPVTPLDITIPQPKQERAQADTGSMAKGREVLQRAQKAAGGADKLAGLKDAVAEAEAQISGPMAGGLTVKQVKKIVFPSTIRNENELPFGKIVLFTDGKMGWMQGPQGQMPLPAAQMQQARGEIFRQTETLLLSDRDAGRTVNFVKQEKAGDRDADVIEISTKDGLAVQLYIDAASGDVLKKAYRGEALAGPAASVAETYEDYKDVNGIRAPFKTVVFQNDKKFAETRYTKIEYNTGLKVEDLAKP